MLSQKFIFLSIQAREKIHDITVRISINQKITMQKRIFVKIGQKIIHSI